MKALALSLVALSLAGVASAAEPVRIVAAENFYGDLARQIGGAHVQVTSILTNPDQDPHLFEASPSTAEAVATAAIVIANGADYDPWMQKLLGASKTAGRQEIDVGALIGAKPGANPHLWYAPANMKAAARALTEALAAADPPHAADYAASAAPVRAIADSASTRRSLRCAAATRVSPSPLPSRCSAMRRRPSGSTCASRNSRLR